MPGVHILIVGGGANGVAAFIQLVSELIIGEIHQNVRLTIVERNDVIGEGLAFGTKQPGHLLNTQSGLMGIYPYEPDHYGKWLAANRHLVPDDELKQYDDPEDSYTTRRLYSVYLQECFSEYIRLAQQHHIVVTCRNGEAIDIQPHTQGYRVLIEDEEWMNCDIVILAPGTPKSRTYEELKSFENYIDFPWPSYRLLNIPSDATIGILGTSLSSIDAVMTLVDNDHQGKIALLSPDGLLPRVQPRKENDYSCEYLTLPAVHAIRRNTLRSPTVFELFRLYQQEVHHYYGHKLCWRKLRRTGRSAQSLLEEDIAVAEQGGDGLLNVLYATREISTQVWEWLSVEDKQQFKRWLGIDWQITRHAMPMHNARRLKDLFSREKLFVYDDLKDVRSEANKFQLTHGNQTLSTDYVINATGPGNSVEEMKSKLIENIHKSGLIESYPAGGIRINTQTMEAISSRHRTDGIYAIGHITNGMLLDSNAVWFNVRAIASMVKHIVNRKELAKT